mmetsp:Transcript_16047/g.40434  ORF Transcript_16047/g.40434 Transcript_16047/m.40434 type:complete len:354 (+) Transcript_16047:3-1064(+)
MAGFDFALFTFGTKPLPLLFASHNVGRPGEDFAPPPPPEPPPEPLDAGQPAPPSPIADLLQVEEPPPEEPPAAAPAPSILVAIAAASPRERGPWHRCFEVTFPAETEARGLRLVIDDEVGNVERAALCVELRNGFSIWFLSAGGATSPPKVFLAGELSSVGAVTMVAGLAIVSLCKGVTRAAIERTKPAGWDELYKLAHGGAGGASDGLRPFKLLRPALAPSPLGVIPLIPRTLAAEEAPSSDAPAAAAGGRLADFGAEGADARALARAYLWHEPTRDRWEQQRGSGALSAISRGRAACARGSRVRQVCAGGQEGEEAQAQRRERRARCQSRCAELGRVGRPCIPSCISLCIT